MKLYFAKYLPVEGEMREGDNTIDNTGSIGINVSSQYLALRNIIGLRKAKLFLCSKDIQIGDEYSFELKTNDWRKGTCHTEGEAERLKSAGIFKVIGEISPEATWVKEGMEFDENEIKAIMHIYHGGWVAESRVKHYAIKGPCGHFH